MNRSVFRLCVRPLMQPRIRPLIVVGTLVSLLPGFTTCPVFVHILVIVIRPSVELGSIAVEDVPWCSRSKAVSFKVGAFVAVDSLMVYL